MTTDYTQSAPCTSAIMKRLLTCQIKLWQFVYNRIKVTKNRSTKRSAFSFFWLREQENKLAAGYAIFPKSLGDFPQSLQSQEGVEHSAAKQDHLSDKPWSGTERQHMKNLNTIERYNAHTFLQSTPTYCISPPPQGSIRGSHSMFDMKYYTAYINR